jgi:regulation of enolase protein 1 (concanavalin A-like superfamily)
MNPFNKIMVIAAIFIVYPMCGIMMATGHWIEAGILYFSQMPLLVKVIEKL